VFSTVTLDDPVAMLQAPGDATRWFVVEQGGTVKVFNASGTPTTTTIFADIRDRVSPGTGEDGLLGMAFHPDYPTPALVYLSYTNDNSGLVSRVSEFPVAGGTVDEGSERILMTVAQPQANHNGGGIAFGPDGFLYIGFGDGGGADDQNHGLIGNGQSLTTLLGKMLRIDVNGTTVGGFNYAIPAGNVTPAGTPCGNGGSSSGSTCPEIHAFGFRNPWRWSFDRVTGELWVGDVGQGTREEVDRVVARGNYGWRCFEGSVGRNLACGSLGSYLPPIAEYGRSVGASVTGGYVYRGTAVPALVGRYVFGDFISRRIFNIDATAAPGLGVSQGHSSGFNISSFGEGVDGELYVVDHGGALYRIAP
jgi:glucose/arabinose dehydrogenase